MFSSHTPVFVLVTLIADGNQSDRRVDDSFKFRPTDSLAIGLPFSLWQSASRPSTCALGPHESLINTLVQSQLLTAVWHLTEPGRNPSHPQSLTPLSRACVASSVSARRDRSAHLGLRLAPDCQGVRGAIHIRWHIGDTGTT